MEQPIKLVNKREKIKHFRVSYSNDSIFGATRVWYLVQAYQHRPPKGGGNSGPSGRRAGRWYHGRAVRKRDGKGWWKKATHNWQTFHPKVERIVWSK